MANEDMDGMFLGGGAIDHVVEDGDIFLSANDLATLFLVTGINWGQIALAYDDIAGAGGAHVLLEVSQKIDELRSELLKREAEALFGQELPFADFDLNTDFFGEE